MKTMLLGMCCSHVCVTVYDFFVYEFLYKYFISPSRHLDYDNVKLAGHTIQKRQEINNPKKRGFWILLERVRHQAPNEKQLLTQ